MPITTSAKKALRQSEQHRSRNREAKSAMKEAIRALERAAGAGNAEEARKLLPLAYKKLDKSVKKGLIKKNTASRKKSRLSRVVKKLGGSPLHAQKTV